MRSTGAKGSWEGVARIGCPISRFFLTVVLLLSLSYLLFTMFWFSFILAIFIMRGFVLIGIEGCFDMLLLALYLYFSVRVDRIWNILQNEFSYTPTMC